MKRLITIAFAVLMLSGILAAQEVVKTSHPRLIFDKKEFKELKHAVRQGDNEPLLLIHNNCLKAADSYLGAAPYVYARDAGGRRIQSTHIPYNRLSVLSYAYRYTKDKRYLDAAEKMVTELCNFPTWNPSHYLDVAMIGRAVALAYDWLYHDLKPSTRELVCKTLREYVLETADGHSFYRTKSNWNSVCNCGVTTVAIAIYESDPEFCSRFLNAAKKSNPAAMKKCYSPDGNYAEGPGYWDYGTSYEVFMLSQMEACLGTDFGLSDIEGFSRTPQYMLFSCGPSGQYFNFSDNNAGLSPRLGMWYFADKFKDPSVLYNELNIMRKGYYNSVADPILLLFALHLDTDKIAPPSEKIFAGRGDTPVVMVRSSWDKGPEDRYLGIKGGQAKYSHAHMDAGSFVYDACGMRWALDLGNTPYAPMEQLFAPDVKAIWSYAPDSWRWHFTFYNNRHHNTLTVNGKNHEPLGFAPLLEVFDTDAKRGASFDLTAVFGGDLARAIRQATVRDGSYLEVVDSLMTPSGSAATIRWNLVTPAQPEITGEGIVLTQKGVRMLLSAAVAVEAAGAGDALAPGAAGEEGGAALVPGAAVEEACAALAPGAPVAAGEVVAAEGAKGAVDAGAGCIAAPCGSRTSGAGLQIRYKIWQPEIEERLASCEISYAGKWICGFELDLPAGTTATLTTTLKQQE